jgi:hypothetical protein
MRTPTILAGPLAVGPSPPAAHPPAPRGPAFDGSRARGLPPIPADAGPGGQPRSAITLSGSSKTTASPPAQSRW